MKSNISKQEELVMNRIMNKWEKVESKLYIAGVLGWINVVVREEIRSLLALQRKSMIEEVDSFWLERTIGGKPTWKQCEKDWNKLKSKLL